MADELTDILDWPAAPMRNFERHLRCPICQDSFHTAVMLRTCSHNFCSLCVRRALSVVGECPVCRKPAGTADLEINRVLDELVGDFNTVRAEILAAMNNSIAMIDKKEEKSNETRQKRQTGEDPSQVLTSPQNSDAPQSRKSKRIASITKETPVQGVVACPICQLTYPQPNIEAHVDLCIIRGATSSSTLRKSESDSAGREHGPMKRIKKPVYNLLKDSDIKRLLLELGLPATGDRDVMMDY